FLRTGPDAPVPDRSALQHGSATAAGAATKNPVEHRRPRPPAVPGPGPVEHRPAVPRTLDARARQPAQPAEQPAKPGRTGAALRHHGPRPARTHEPAPRQRPATALARAAQPVAAAPARR